MKRYEFDPTGVAAEAADGDWVRYDDVAALEEELRRLRRDEAGYFVLEELAERFDGIAHDHLEAAGRGHRKPACTFGDGADTLAEELKRGRDAEAEAARLREALGWAAWQGRDADSRFNPFCVGCGTHGDHPHPPTCRVAAAFAPAPVPPPPAGPRPHLGDDFYDPFR